MKKKIQKMNIWNQKKNLKKMSKKYKNQHYYNLNKYK